MSHVPVMIYILYSGDYEIYFGRNDLPETDVLVKPTAHLLNKCTKLNIPMTLFCDVTCLWKYKELGINEFPNDVEKQLREAIAQGHDVQAHIHPHWQFAKRAENQWEYSTNSFLLGTVFDDEYECEKFTLNQLINAKKYLEQLLKPIKPTYQCHSYRAGGYGIQPRTAMIIRSLISSGYLIDSSIVPGLKAKTGVNNINFSYAPKRPNYYLAESNDLKESDKGIFEIPVAAATLSFNRWIHQRANLLKAKLKKHQNSQPRGKSIQMVLRQNEHLLIKLFHFVKRNLKQLQSRWCMLELVEDDSQMLNVTKNYLKQFDLINENVYFSLSCHPKDITEDKLSALEKYHLKLMTDFKNLIQPITFDDVAKKLIGASS